MNNEPQPLSPREWKELARVPAIRDGFGLHTAAEANDFPHHGYAVKFNYCSDCPGYAGELFVVLGGDADIPPLVLVRRDKKLVRVDAEER